MGELKFVEMTIEVKVMSVGGGTVTMTTAGKVLEVSIPAVQEMERWAAAHLYQWIKFRVLLGSSMEADPFGDVGHVPRAASSSP